MLVWQNNPISDWAPPRGSAVLWLGVLDRLQQHFNGHGDMRVLDSYGIGYHMALDS